MASLPFYVYGLHAPVIEDFMGKGTWFYDVFENVKFGQFFENLYLINSCLILVPIIVNICRTTHFFFFFFFFFLHYQFSF